MLGGCYEENAVHLSYCYLFGDGLVASTRVVDLEKRLLSCPPCRPWARSVDSPSFSRFAQLQGSLPCMSLAASERFEGDEVFWVRLRIVIRDKDLGRVNIVNC